MGKRQEVLGSPSALLKTELQRQRPHPTCGGEALEENSVCKELVLHPPRRSLQGQKAWEGAPGRTAVVLLPPGLPHQRPGGDQPAVTPFRPPPPGSYPFSWAMQWPPGCLPLKWKHPHRTPYSPLFRVQVQTPHLALTAHLTQTSLAPGPSGSSHQAPRRVTHKHTLLPQCPQRQSCAAGPLHTLLACLGHLCPPHPSSV